MRLRATVAADLVLWNCAAAVGEAAAPDVLRVEFLQVGCRDELREAFR